MKDQQKIKAYPSNSVGVCFEPLEPRLLLSGTWGTGAADPGGDGPSPAADGWGTQTATLQASVGDLERQVDVSRQLQQRGRVDLLAEAPALHTGSNDSKSVADENRALVEQPSTVAASRELVFVDDGIDGYEHLVEGVLANASKNRALEVIVLDADGDGIDQVSRALANRQDLDAIHFLAHGEDGAVKLGATWLDNDSLNTTFADDISGWQAALSPEADLLFYGCDLAAGEDGRMLLDDLGTLTGADVAASDDLTGSARLGGDWDLEFNSGRIETGLAVSPEARLQWAGVLAAFTVDTTADTADANPGDGLAQDASGNTSLRAAIEEANALAGADEISLAAGTYTLTNGDLVITDDVSIKGADANTTAVDGNAADRVFTIENNSTASISEITVMNGDQNNSGGVFVDNGSTLNLSDAIVKDNNSNMGGGVHVHGTANLNRVLLVNNTASEGGAIHFHGADGGSLTNVTISGNTASAEGGGLWTDSSITLTNVTIADNNATTQGGGMFIAGGTLDMANSIVADNSAGGSGQDIQGAVSSSGYNIVEDAAGVTGLIGTDQSVDPLLGALADNGGSLMTHAPTAAEAIDTADRSLMPPTDQRGFLRGDGSPDIGAHEVGASAASTGDYLDQFNTGGSYAGDDGSLSWSNDWQEVNEADSAIGGNARVTDAFSGDGGGNVELAIKNSKGVWREADLSGAVSATLSFDYVRNNFEAGDHLVVYIQTAGGTGGVAVGDAPGTWDEIGRYSGVADDGAYLPASIDISGYIADDTRILLILDSAVPTDDEIYIDNVRIELSSLPPNAEQVLAVNAGTTVDEGTTGNTITAVMLQTTDVDNTADQLVYTVTTAPVNGTLYLSGAALSAGSTFTQDDIDNGRVTYDHDDSENLSDSFDFSVDDGAGTATTDTFSISVTAVNDNNPVADDESFTVAEGGTATQADLDAGTSLLDGDTDVDLPNDTLTVTTTPLAGPSHGSLTLNADGTFSYTHDGTENFTDSFTYVVSDADVGVTDTGTVTITINPINDNDPVATDETITVDQGATITTLDGGPTSVLANDNDTDLPNDSLSVSLGSGPSFGSLTLNADGSFSYTHDGSANLADSFTYVVADADGGTTDTGTVTITINLLSMPPTATNLNAAESYTEEMPLDLADIVVTDVDSATVTVTLTLSDPAAGSLSTATAGTVTSTFSGGVWTAGGPTADVNTLLAGVVFTPAVDYDGNLSIAASLNDGMSAPASGVKIMTGTPVGDTPQVGHAATPANTPSDLIVIDRNAHDGGEVTHFRISGITNGSLYLADGTTPIHNGDYISVAQGQAGVRFSPDTGSIAPGSFRVEASEDGVSVALQSGAVTAVINVIPPASSPSEESSPGGDAAADPMPDPEPESPETITEPVVDVLEPAPEALVPPAAAAAPAATASNRQPTAARTPYLIKAAHQFGRMLGADTYVRTMAQRQTGNQADYRADALPDREPGPADRQAGLHNRMAARAYLNMVNSLDDVKNEMAGEIAFKQTVLGSAIAVSTGLSVGYVVWLIRGGMLLSSLLSSIPAWQILDPLPVLAVRKDEADVDDDESLASMLARKPGRTAKKKNPAGKLTEATEET